MSPSEHERVVRRMVEAAGHTTQSLGWGRVVGQIFAFLYLNPKPRTLDDLTASLGISKGSASMCVRQLEQWGALEKVWIKGDRKDYYRAREAFGTVVRNMLLDMVGKRMESSSALLRQIDDELTRQQDKGGSVSDEDRFIRQRVETIRKFQKKAKTMWESSVLRVLLR